MSVALSILDSLVSGVVAIDREVNITVCNEAAAGMLGITKKQAVGLNLLTLVPNAGLINVLRTGQPEVGRLRVKGGRTILASRTPILHNGVMIGAVSVFQDITEMEKISRELDSTKVLVHTLEEVLAGAGEWMVVVDSYGFITMMSEDYAAFNGMSLSEAIGKHVTEVIENTRMHIVAQTGVAEMGESQSIRGTNVIVNRVPLKDGDRIVGAYGRVVFKDMEQLWELAAKLKVLESKVRYYEKELTHLRGARYTFRSILGSGPAITAAKGEALWAAKGDSTVLLSGETGTGKELFAHSIHAAGRRRSGPFIKLNCAAVPAELIESELFGYEEGAFTGAKKGGKPGKFEMAAGGTLFLDEIGDMPASMQAKLLRVLQEREVERLGGTSARRIDLRIIAATAQKLEELVGQGKFRADLYYRIHVIPIRIPALRERIEDIEPVSTNFLARYAVETGEPVRKISLEALDVLRSYHWPGNVRELQNVLERSAALSRGDTIMATHLPPHLLAKAPTLNKAPAPGSLAGVRIEAERNAILAALQATGGNKSRAASLLQIHRVKLHEKIRRYGIMNSESRITGDQS